MCLNYYYAKMAHGWAEVQLHSFLTSALEEVSGQLHASAALPEGTRRSCSLDRTLDAPQSRVPRRNSELIWNQLKSNWLNSLTNKINSSTFLPWWSLNSKKAASLLLKDPYALSFCPATCIFKNENEYGALVEWYWQGKTEVLGEKHHIVWVVGEWKGMEHWWNGTDRKKLK